ncbi:hypothetical protein PSN45_002660 [Yamadazyma tenuis]|uniref:DUF159-domain-containing protein n=1 Tax=Candida tenuis (strain ATCC 10573 / BCRC 21748 / CBS 615 / JCM 9827 / NBRC 10315 / NRRL Y-1498 / VKM Y-70) TaxID=590646 RepID=G3AX89_CANTC|nr:DUF159-domain-containing protein [Yamadazyma tenuis ATCC 10573]XP_006684150.1 uncharacterized protein CANTEDRAFT_117936 [Yamadazyma tenuis ATCC 10573]EGV66891.1 DUF159-domain-containing protein [Yamadazyma tenuis ATCC 10573]EGV66892.1 hypothetical protein CANTEDRAFT_117936 [Yamadazyma tenuis ATCC 10573]WEJ95147.1 hypothetical protein PSN45_002660 [Yamadazyma tenuis]
MCGRYAMTVDVQQLPSQFTRTALRREDPGSSNTDDVKKVTENTYSTTETHFNGSEENVKIFVMNGLEGYRQSYNVAPTKNELIIYKQYSAANNVEYIMETSGFGLVPNWSKPGNTDPLKEVRKQQAMHFNCRRETLLQTSSIWNASKKTRCVVPIQGYYEWMKIKTQKVPYYVFSKDQPLIYLAGFYSHNKNFTDNFNNDQYLSTFTIITGPATKEDSNDLSWLHSRKPIFLKPGTQQWDDWLDPKVPWSHELQIACLDTLTNPAFESITCHKVSRDVGNTSKDGEYLIKELKQEEKRGAIDSFFKKRPNPQISPSPDAKKVKTEPSVKEELD